MRLMGALGAAERDALRFNFQAAARGTVAQDAELDITASPMPARCPVCRAEVEMTDHHQVCTTANPAPHPRRRNPARHRIGGGDGRGGAGLHCLRDLTRGGLAAVLNEWARQSKVGMVIREKDIPVRSEAAAACEFLVLDPLYLANEGKLVAVCPPQSAADLLAAMRRHPLARDAAVIGEVREDDHHFVEMETAFGGRRLVDWLSSDPLPRIC